MSAMGLSSVTDVRRVRMLGPPDILPLWIRAQGKQLRVVIVLLLELWFLLKTIVLFFP